MRTAPSWLAALAIALVPALAIASSDRGATMSVLGGISGVAPPDAAISDVPFTPMVGLALAWERRTPTADGLADPIATAALSPDVALSVHGRRPMVLAGMRFGLMMTNPRLGTLAVHLAPRIGAITDASTPVLGGELGMSFAVHRTWRVGFVYGIYGWREADPTRLPIAGTLSRTVAPSSPQLLVVQGQLALVVGSEL